MKLSQTIALVTGASGGIGAAIAREILASGGSALLTGRDASALEHLAHTLEPSGARLSFITADISSPTDRNRLCRAARAWRGGVNVLINNAGVAGFGLFEHAREDSIEHTFAVNALAPIELCRSLLPHLAAQPEAHIVNIGSVFGAIGYPGHAVYSATKFALRGFSEALRRELNGSSVRVHYLAPRATRTHFNNAAVEKLNARFRTAMDPPERVAQALRTMLEHDQPHAVVGWPEKLFARLNGVFPGLIDRALAKQLPTIRQHATSCADATARAQQV